MAVLAFVGFGELGRGLAEGLGSSGRHELRAYLRKAPAPGSGTDQALARVGVQHSVELSAAMSGADAVLVVVPPASAREVATRCAPLLRRGTLYVDFASAAPEHKEEAAAIVERSGALYVDVAVLGTVLMSGHEVPMLASGAGAHAWQALVTPDGLRVTAIDAPAGHAALVKLLRSIYVKGRDALIVETMLAAKRHGLEDLVADSIDGPGEHVSFPALADRVLCSLAMHAERRADELAAASDVVRRAGIDPALTRAGSETLRAVASLGLAEAWGGKRPTDAGAVLAAIDERSRRRH